MSEDQRRERAAEGAGARDWFSSGERKKPSFLVKV